MSRGARDPRQPVTLLWDPTTYLLSVIASADDLPISGFTSPSSFTFPVTEANLSQVRLTSTGGTNFDAGSWRVVYE